MELVTAGQAKIGRIFTPMQVPDYFDVTITTAQLLALFATPRSILPAPGVGFFNLFEGALLYMPYNSIAYNGVAAGEDLAVNYTNGGGLQLGSCETTGFLDQAASKFRWIQPYRAASGVSDIVAVENAAIVLQLLTGEIATGNSPLKVRTFFRRLPTTF
jgi:hypothetical protein